MEIMLNRSPSIQYRSLPANGIPSYFTLTSLSAITGFALNQTRVTGVSPMGSTLLFSTMTRFLTVTPLHPRSMEPYCKKLTYIRSKTRELLECHSRVVLTLRSTWKSDLYRLLQCNLLSITYRSLRQMCRSCCRFSVESRLPRISSRKEVFTHCRRTRSSN